MLPKPAPLLPSAKQVKYLDALARELGYESGKQFTRDFLGVDKHGLPDWTRSSVHKAISEAKNRVERSRRLGRNRGELQTRQGLTSR